MTITEPAAEAAIRAATAQPHLPTVRDHASQVQIGRRALRDLASAEPPTSVAQGVTAVSEQALSRCEFCAHAEITLRGRRDDDAVCRETRPCCGMPRLFTGLCAADAGIVSGRVYVRSCPKSSQSRLASARVLGPAGDQRAVVRSGPQAVHKWMERQ